MSTLFNIVRGSVKLMPGNVDPSIIRLGDLKTEANDKETTIVSNFSVRDNEKLGMIQCFNNTNHLYAFGHDPENSGFSATYIAFIGEACMQGGKFRLGKGVDSVIGWYKENKVSKGKIVTFTFGGQGIAVSGVVCSMEVDVFDVEMNALVVSISGKVLRWAQ